MAIRMMVGKERAGEPGIEGVYGYPGHGAQEICHSSECRKAGTAKLRELVPTTDPAVLEADCGCPVYGPLFFETTHQGLVLDDREKNYHDDSDFYAVVWVPERRDIAQVFYATTRGWTYPNGCTIDATPEVRAEFERFRELVNAQLAAERSLEHARKALAAAEIPQRGDRVRVIRKLKRVAKGAEGEVFWSGEDRFSGRPRLGFLEPGCSEKRWVNVASVEIVGRSPEREEQLLEARAELARCEGEHADATEALESWQKEAACE